MNLSGEYIEAHVIFYVCHCGPIQTKSVHFNPHNERHDDLDQFGPDKAVFFDRTASSTLGGAGMSTPSTRYSKPG